MTRTSKYEDNFNHLYSHLLGAAATYHSWKGLQDKQNEEIWSEARYFWSSVLISLQNEWLIALAKGFEESKHSREGVVVSAFTLLETHPDSKRAQEARQLLKGHSDTIKHISIIRHNRLAHLNADHLSNPTRLLEQFPIKYDNVEFLLEDLPKLFSLLNPEQGHGYMISNYTEQPEHEAQHIMSQLAYYRDKREEHRDKVRKGEIDDYHFPPTSGNVAT